MVGIQYHPFIQDPFGTPYSDERYAYYGGTARPEAYVDGILKRVGDTGDLESIYRRMVESRIDIPPDFDIRASGELAGRNWSVSGVVEALDAIPNSGSIRVVVVEDSLWHNGDRYDQVCRAGSEDIPLTAFVPGDVQAFSVDFDLPAEVTPERAGVIVWVQDDVTTEVLQAKRISEVSLVIETDGPEVSPGERLRISYGLHNVTGITQQVWGWLDGVLPTGAPVPGNPLVGPIPVTLAPGQEIEGAVFLGVPGSAPAGDYELVGRVGPEPDRIWEESRVPATIVLEGNRLHPSDDGKKRGNE